VHFNKDLSLRRETTLVGNSDLQLLIIEPLTTNRESLLPIKLSARAVFSKYSLTPARGINFGPVTHGSVPRPRVFELVNLGEFPFEFKLSDFKDAALVSSAPAPAVVDPKKAPAKTGKGVCRRIVAPVTTLGPTTACVQMMLRV
jgi:hydrocephalus-inducing protein